mmetsp:Transcript_61260/g.144579  ORF Transcript_61260/g.144579 Transcript_61260/m.144579 type:complete len:83 (-) Transcript_61260:64-312(-)
MLHAECRDQETLMNPQRPLQAFQSFDSTASLQNCRSNFPPKKTKQQLSSARRKRVRIRHKKSNNPSLPVASTEKSLVTLHKT